MSKKEDLFELIVSLNDHEKRYIIRQGIKKDGSENEYVRLFRFVSRMTNYSDKEFKAEYKKSSGSEKVEVKKHYLYQWVLKHLYDFHSKDYSNSAHLRDITILIDHSLYSQAQKLLPAVKKRLIESESYTNLLSLLEKELLIARFNNKLNVEKVFEELHYYSKLYSDLQIILLLKHNFRQQLNDGTFLRKPDEKTRINKLINHPILHEYSGTTVFQIVYTKNLIYYWYNATQSNWYDAFGYAFSNYKLLLKNKNAEKYFPDECLNIIYNLLICASALNHPAYKKTLKHLWSLMQFESNYRLRDEARFNYYLARLINLNINLKNKPNSGVIKDAEEYINNNRDKFSNHRTCNFYFDLAKAYFYAGNYAKAFQLLHYIYDKISEKDHSLDFTSFTRILFCICAYEKGETELMIYTAKATVVFLKRKRIYYKFESKTLSFIINELPYIGNYSSKVIKNKFLKFNSQLNELLINKYEKNALNYFDLSSWIKAKLTEN